jgi:hypothetical protein
MSTRAVASGVINLPIEVVWKQLRQFDFPARLLSQTIAKVELEEHANKTTVGGGISLYICNSHASGKPKIFLATLQSKKHKKLSR